MEDDEAEQVDIDDLSEDESGSEEEDEEEEEEGSEEDEEGEEDDSDSDDDEEEETEYQKEVSTNFATYGIPHVLGISHTDAINYLF